MPSVAIARLLMAADSKTFVTAKLLIPLETDGSDAVMSISTRAVVGDILKQARTIRGLSRAEVARQTGVTVAGVGLWEQDRNYPTHERLVSLCQLLSIDLTAAVRGELVLLDDNGTVPVDVPVPRRPSETREIIRLLTVVASVIEEEVDLSASPKQALRWLIKRAGLSDRVFDAKADHQES